MPVTRPAKPRRPPSPQHLHGAILCAMTRWTNEEELDAFIASRSAGIILKHSTRCSISSEALKELEAFEREDPAVPAFLVLVIESRPLSSAIAQKLGIPHASPQALLVRDGAVVWHATHWEITRDALQAAWKSPAGERA